MRRLRDAIEADAPPEKIEEGWDCLRAIEAEFSTFYGGVETRLSPYVRISLRVRELLRGASSLPKETKTPKVTQ